MPKNHVKPTSEELEANAKKAAEDLDKMDEKEEKVEEKDEKVEEKEEVKEEKKVVEEEKEDPDYKKKYIASQQESLILHAKNKQVNEALDKVSKFADPTQEELKKEYTDWDVMSEFEKKMAKESSVNTKRFKAFEKLTIDNKSIEAWNTKVNEYIGNPKTLIASPELEGKEAEFKLFAIKQTRVNMDFDDIKAAFLYDATKNAKPKSKGKMMETGTGGPANKGKKPGILTIEEGRTLRNRDYTQWKRKLDAGKIESL